MKFLKTIILLSAILLLGCKSEEIGINKPEEKGPNPETEASAEMPKTQKGVIRVKLNRETGDNFAVTQTGGQLRSGSTDIDSYLQQIGAKTMTRVFSIAGKYEKRSRREGLHLWYDITFNESSPVTRTASDARNIPGVDIVEEVPVYTRPPHTMSLIDLSGTRSVETAPFNDPLLGQQWHYNNLGELGQKDRARFVPGADCNLFEAWATETGKPNVVVAVQDGGVDVTHQDLKDNMWINEAELNGEPDVDDDGNGFVDDIHGYDFVGKKGKIDPDNHGTHVAGTVAARNNNGIGVCGVAGGDGSPRSGVRIMSCQMFGKGTSGGSAGALKYQADNGAVISQNSWGGGAFTASLQAAIDYFIKYAGCDDDGNQLPNSPMKGGVVIFAAGNDDRDYLVIPASYTPVVAVSAMAPDYKKASYTNRGDWVDIMAPGGGGDKFPMPGNVLSCVPNNRYGWMSGTSMACPHVSGIAALIVSHYGKQGFSNEMLEEKLMSALRPRDINKSNPGFEGRLGRGYIDAGKVFAVNNNKKPRNVSNVAVKENFTSLELTWKIVADEDDQIANTYLITLQAKGKTTIISKEVYFERLQPGNDVVFVIESLPLDTQCDMTITAMDRWGLKSETHRFVAKTKKNNPPLLSATGYENIRLAESETSQVKIKVTEPEGQVWTYKVAGQQQGVSVKKEGDDLVVNIRAIAPAGEYTVTVSVADIFNASTTIEIPFEIYENHPPKLTKEFKPLFIPLGKTDRKIDLIEYFTDEDGHELTFTSKSNDPSALGVTTTGSVVAFAPQAQGQALVSVSATDKFETKASSNIQVYVVKDELVYVMYPIPASDVLHVRLSDEVSNATLCVLSSIGQKVLSKNVSVSDNNRMVDLDVSRLAGGSYILLTEANGKIFRKSFVKH